MGDPDDRDVVMTGIIVPADGSEDMGNISTGVEMTGIIVPADGVDGTDHISIGVMVTGVIAPAEGLEGTVHILVGSSWPSNQGHACGCSGSWNGSC